MKKYKTIDELDARIERIIKNKLEAYYTDWKNYDRPKYMKMKGSRNRDEKQIMIIARQCGCYLFTLEELKNYAFAMTCLEYYGGNDKNDFYLVNLDRLTIEKINPLEYEKELKKELRKAA